MGSDRLAIYFGNTDPGAVGPGIYWLTDTDPHNLLRRNEADTDWVAVGLASADVADLATAVVQPGRNIYEAEIIGDEVFIHGKQYPGYTTSGRMFILQNQHNFGTLSGQTLVANRCYYVPVYIGDVVSASINAMVANITANVTGDLQMGWFDADQDNLLPTNRLAQTTKASVSSTGSLIQSLAATGITRHRWYNAALASVTARAVNGTNDEDQIPALRGGMDTSFSKPGIMSYEALAPGWTTLPAVASPTTQNALWLQFGARQG